MPLMEQETPAGQAPTLRATLLGEIDAFCTSRDMKPSEFGKLAVGDVSFVGRLRKGMSVGIDRVDKVRQFMASYRPQGRGKR